MASDKLWRVARFALVGGINTGVDLVIFLTLTHFGLAIFWANVISTSCAFGVSYLLNRGFVFKQNTGSGKQQIRQFVVFALITFIGLWALQPLVIAGVSKILEPLQLAPTLTLGAGKILATCVTMVWNYVLYGKFVFKA